MAARDPYLPARCRMVERLQAQGIADARVLDALAQVPPELFVPQALRVQAYEEVRLPIGLSQTISAPRTVARMTELLLPEKGTKVLEVGTGSGYQAAVLAALGLIVFSVERHAELARTAAERLRKLGYPGVSVHHFDGTYGWAAWAPNRGILVTAAGPELPQTLQRQLDERGRIVMPLVREGQQRMVVFTRQPDGSVREAPEGTTPREIAKSIGPGLARAALAARVDGAIVDLDRPLLRDARRNNIRTLAKIQTQYFQLGILNRWGSAPGKRSRRKNIP